MQNLRKIRKDYNTYFDSQHDPIVTTKNEIVNLTALKDYASKLSTPYELQDYINHVESIGINYNGFKMGNQ